MNRESRRANFKKLQLPSGGEDKRVTRSSTIAMTNISHYFGTTDKPPFITKPLKSVTSPSPPEGQESEASKNMPQASTSTRMSKPKRTKLTAFVLRGNDDFETPVKQIKKAPSKMKKPKTAKERKSKRQPNIKSAFLRNEQMFAEITAQHCLADNFRPDEVELALALSKSEVQVDVMECDGPEETIREKLQKYGFRTAKREDYNAFATAFLPGANERRQKSRWANKFTALTLRNADEQLKKINQKIEALLTQQLTTKSPAAAETRPAAYSPVATLLRKCQVAVDDLKVIKCSQIDDPISRDLHSYFVDDLFAVSELKAGYLLKDWRAIQGRDLSPQKRCVKTLFREEKLRTIYAELERYFVGREVLDAATATQVNVSQESDGAVELNAFLELIDILPAESVSKKSPLQQPEKRQDNSILNAENECKSKVPPAADIRANSPDIFADSDAEMNDIQGITIYENYSSDEVNTSCVVDMPSIPSSAQKSFIDLTQDETDEEAVQDKTQISKLDTNAKAVKALITENNVVLEAIGTKYLAGTSRKGTTLSPAQVHKCAQRKRRFTMDDVQHVDEMRLFQRRSKSAVLPLLTPPLQFTTSHRSDSFLLLDDDEICQSIVDEPREYRKKTYEFSFLDMLEAEEVAWKASSESLDSELQFGTPTENANNTRAEFGILESPSQPAWTQRSATVQTPTPDKSNYSVLHMSRESTAPMRRFRSDCGTQRFDALLDAVRHEQDDLSAEFDEMDRLIYGSPKRQQAVTTSSKTPEGLAQLLTAEISYRRDVDTFSTLTNRKQESPPTEEVVIDSRVYTVRPCTEPKPEYNKYTDAELLGELYAFGIKALKRKQAVKMLEHIYSQTHPIAELAKCTTETAETHIDAELERLRIKYGCSQP